MAAIEIKLVNGELAGKTFQEIKKSVNSAALELNKAKIGTEEWVKASKKLTDAKQLQEDYTKQLKATTSASDQLKKAMLGLPGGQYFQQIGQAFSGLKGGVGGLSSSFGVLKQAIISTGLGIFIVLLGGLVNWLSKVEAVTNFLKGAFDGLMAAVNVLMKAIATLSFDNLGEDMATAAKEGYNLVQAFDALEDKQREISLAAEKSGLVVDQLLLQSKNVQKSFEERIDLLDQAGEEETKIHQQRLDYANEYAAAVDREVANAQRQGVMNDELADKQLEAQKAVIAVNRESIVLQEKIANRRSALEEKQAAEAEKRAEAARKRKEEDRKLFEQEQKEQEDAAKKIEDLKLAVMKEGLDKQIAQIELDAARKKEALKGTDQQIIEAALLLEQEKAQLIQAAKDKIKAEQDAKDEAARLKERQKIMDDLTLDIATEQNILNEQRLNNQITDEQFVQLSVQQAMAFQVKKLELIKAAHGEESIEYQRANAEYIAMQQKTSDSAVAIKKKEIEDQRAALMGGLQVAGNFFGQLASMQEAGSKQAKAFAVAQAIISTIQGTINAYQSTAAIPIVGPVLAPVAAAVAFAAGMANVNKIRNQQVPKMNAEKKEQGGLLYGPRHSEGGIPIEAEGGEFIFSRKAVAAIGVGTLTRVNDRYTKRMETGGPVNPFQDRGPVSSNGGAFEFDYEKLAMVMNKQVENRISRIKVVNVATETQAVNDDLLKIQNEADA